jgi:hypothetical protein
MTIEGMVHAEEIQWIEIGCGVPGLELVLRGRPS